MEQIVVALSPFTRACRSLAVTHGDHDLAHGLDQGEHVLVHDPVADEHYSAIVADVSFDLAETTYRLEIGGRITAREAADWSAPSLEEDHLTTGDLVALLSELRRSERDISTALADLRAR
jgi:hypothetical protein